MTGGTVKRPAQKETVMAELCPLCHQPVTSFRQETELLEMYDDGPGPVGDPRRLNTSPTRRNLPGPTHQTWEPCGHSRTIYS